MPLGRLSKNIVGSLFWELVPDAIVIIDESLHRRYVSRRSGAEALQWSDVERIRNVLLEVIVLARGPSQRVVLRDVEHVHVMPVQMRLHPVSLARARRR